MSKLERKDLLTKTTNQEYKTAPRYLKLITQISLTQIKSTLRA